MASALPVNGAQEQELAVEGRPRNPGDRAITVQTVLIGPRYFETLGLTLAAGRGFSGADGSPGQPHAIVNERLARQIFAEASPLGRRIAIGAAAPQGKAPEWLTIVGVAPDVRQRPVPDAGPIVYVPFRSSAPSTGSLLVRSSAASAVDLTNTMRTEVHALDSNLPLYRVRTLAQAVRDATWNGRLSARLILAITCIAVALSAVGLYAVTMYGVSQRTQEIGLRVALGARPANIAATIVRRAFVQLAAGFGAGILLTMLWDRMFMGPSPGSRAADPVSLLVVAVTLVVLAALACAVPVRRAIRLDPRTAMNR
jgi:putative ABC transport system permease protein